jgi:DNA replication protein DnaC
MQVLTTYGYDIGREPTKWQLGSATNFNPFRFPDPWALGVEWAKVVRSNTPEYTAALERWLAAHGAAESRVTGEKGGQALLADWALANSEWHERQVRVSFKRAMGDHAELQAWLREKLPEYAHSCGVPTRAMQPWVQQRVTNTPALHAARDCLAQLAMAPMERKQPLLVLMGGYGTGKTTAAVTALMDRLHTESSIKRQPGSRGVEIRVAMPAHVFDLAPSVAFWNAASVARGALFGREAADAIEEAKGCEVFVLDDVGSEHAGDKGPWLSVLDEVLNARYAEGLITLITTNLDWRGFSRWCGTRVADRLREAGRTVTTGSQSLRRPAAHGPAPVSSFESPRPPQELPDGLQQKP